MLTDSGLLRELQRNAISPTRRNAHLTPQMQQYSDKSMSEVRTSVEWLFNDIINYFKFLDFKKTLKVGLSSVGKMYIVSALQFAMVS